MAIHILSDDLAAKIAAGEVIERPASVVKELVENALDAGARDIRLEVRGGGQRLIRVADDGQGIPGEEVPTAFARHGTSKLESADDLFSIRTLGFRGEALPSIAAVARVIMITRAAEEVNGTRYQVENARTLHYQPHGAPRGTVVTVEDLFRNVPARLKFLKSPGAESAHITELVYAYALAYPEVRFSLVSDGKLVFQTAGSGRLSDVLVKVLGVETAREMIPVSDAAAEDAELPLDTPRIGVHGYISPPSIHRGNRRLQYMFVNGRWIEDRSLAHAVAEAYHTLLMVGRFPLFVLALELAPDAVDVNVHPTKMQVRFREPGEVYRHLQRTVRRALSANLPVPAYTAFAPAAPVAVPTLTTAPDDLPLAASAVQFPPAFSSPTSVPVTQLHAPTLAPVAPTSLPMLRVLGQIMSTYIICEGPDGLYLIDQHAAHERVLYEQMRTPTPAVSVMQELLQPMPIELSPFQLATFREEQANLERAGFRVEPFGGQTLLLRAVPTVLKDRDPRVALVEILDMTDEGGHPLQAQAEARLILSICKSAAIKGGQAMSLDEMRALIRDLEKTAAPRTCPHGRPTMIQLNLTMLAREFGRLG